MKTNHSKSCLLWLYNIVLFHGGQILQYGNTIKQLHFESAAFRGIKGPTPFKG